LVGAWATAPFLTETKKGLLRVLMIMTAFLLVDADPGELPVAAELPLLQPVKARVAVPSTAMAISTLLWLRIGFSL